MKTILASALGLAALLATPSFAADAAHAYDNGPVWDVSFVQTKPGHFEEYMKYLDTGWKQQQEVLKKKGIVLSYKVMTPVDARDNDPDIILMVEYKNMAAFDAPLAEQDQVTSQVFGSVDNANKQGIDRESIRTLKGDILNRELILK